MAWTYVGKGSAITAASGDVVLVTTGVTIATGDLVIANIAYRDTPNFTLPTGWTLVAQETSANLLSASSSAIASALMAYIIWPGGSPDMTFVRTAGDVAIGNIVVYRGVKQSGTIVEVVAQATLGAGSSTHTLTGFTTVNPYALLVAAYATGRTSGCSSFRANTDPSASFPDTSLSAETLVSFSEWKRRTDLSTATGADAGINIIDAVKDEVGSTGNFIGVWGTSSRSSMIVAAFTSIEIGGAEETISKLSRYDLMTPPMDKVTASKLSRYDILIPTPPGISITKMSRYDILVIPLVMTIPRRGTSVLVTDLPLFGYDLLSISGTPVLTGTDDVAYAGFTVTGSGGTLPYTYSLFGSWPPGITINATTGAVSGTPTLAGSYPGLSIRVTDAYGVTSDLSTFAITVSASAYPIDVSALKLAAFVSPDQTKISIPAVKSATFVVPDQTKISTSAVKLAVFVKPV